MTKELAQEHNGKVTAVQEQDSLGSLLLAGVQRTLASYHP